MRLPSMLSKMIPNADPEKGLNRSPDTDFSATASITPQRDPHVQDTLTQFRHYVGIHNDPDLNSGRPVANVGLYQRIVKAERNYKKQYKIYSLAINSALGLQTVFDAALTALGAGNGPRSAVTAFGAINTILAGFLTYLKGSGLPNRLKYYENEIVKVREYIEQREREFARGDLNIDLKEEVMIIETWTKPSSEISRSTLLNPMSASQTLQRETAESLNLHGGNRRHSVATHARQEIDDRIYGANEKMASTRRGFELRLSQARLGMESRLSDAQKGFDTRIRETTAGLDDRINHTRFGLESRLSQSRLGLGSRIADTREGLTSQYQHAREGANSQYQQTRAGVENEYHRTRTDIGNQYDQTRTGIENQVDQTRLATQAQVENTRHGIESRIQDTQRDVTAQVELTKHDMQSRMREVQVQVKEQEEKIMGIAEKVAEKVLSVTQKRHEHQVIMLKVYPRHSADSWQIFPIYS